MSSIMIYNYVFKKYKFKCHICKFTSDSQLDFTNHIAKKHKIILPCNAKVKKNIINALNINCNDKEDEEELCVICLDSPKTTAFFRCGHKVCCLDCAKNILNSNDKDSKKCPVCRKIVGGILRIYD